MQVLTECLRILNNKQEKDEPIIFKRVQVPNREEGEREGGKETEGGRGREGGERMHSCLAIR